MKDKEELIKIEFLVAVPHTKGGGVVWTCVEDNILKDNKDHKAIGLERE